MFNCCLSQQMVTFKGFWVVFVFCVFLTKKVLLPQGRKKLPKIVRYREKLMSSL